jgi:hypothetical protein
MRLLWYGSCVVNIRVKVSENNLQLKCMYSVASWSSCKCIFEYGFIPKAMCYLVIFDYGCQANKLPMSSLSAAGKVVV